MFLDHKTKGNIGKKDNNEFFNFLLLKPNQYYMTRIPKK